MTKPVYQDRQKALRRGFGRLGIEASIITKLENIFYLTGFSGTTGILLISDDTADLIVDPRYDGRAREEASSSGIYQAGNVWKGLIALVKERGFSRVGYEQEDVTVADQERFNLKANEAGMDLCLTGAAGETEALRAIKEECEIDEIRKASEITVSAFDHIIGFVEEGVTERDIASELYCFSHLHGADKAAFDIIVASGVRTAMPHAGPSKKPVEKGDLVMIDMGVCYNNYFSDMTRTFSLGPLQDEHSAQYEAVREAQSEALKGLAPGIAAGDADKLARDRLKAAGLEKDFLHGLGHGVGLEIHEAPAIAIGRTAKLEEGMVFTVEPGVYRAGSGGVRIEDTVVLRADGVEILTEWTREIVEL